MKIAQIFSFSGQFLSAEMQSCSITFHSRDRLNLSASIKINQKPAKY